MKKSIIFDFDGTLVDTLELALKFGNENGQRFAKRMISREDFRNRSMREVLTHIELPLTRLPQFVIELKRFLRFNLSNVRLFPGIAELIRDWHERGLDLYIMSSNSRENIADVLRKNGLEKCFKEIFSDSSIFGKHKVLSRMFKEIGLNKQDSIYIGDEVRDLEACNRFALDMIAVTWGWDDESRLLRAGSKKTVSTIAELQTSI